jgi:ABC-type transport system substrate-binding protein
MTKATKRWPAAVILLGLVAAACGSSDGATPAPAPDPTEAPAPEPEAPAPEAPAPDAPAPDDPEPAPETTASPQEPEIIVTVDEEAVPDPSEHMIVAASIRCSQWDPHLGRSAVVDTSLLGPVYDKLVQLQPDLQVGPQLATSWEFGPDNMSITFQLRDDVTFQDGSAFNAEVVKANWDRLRALEESRWRTTLDIIDTITVEGDYTIRIDLNADGTNLPMTMAVTPGVSMMISPLGLEDTEALATTPAGSGQYVLSEQREDGCTYTRHDGYWDPELEGQTPASVNILGLGDADARINGVLTGQFHATVNIEPLEDVDAVVDNESIFLFEVIGSNRTMSVALNFSEEALGNADVRRALSLATDREAIAEVIFAGGATPAVVPMAPGSFGYNPDIALVYDVAAAQALVDGSGITDFEFSIQTFGGRAANEIATVLQQAWGDLGFDIEVVPLEAALSNAAFADGSNPAYVQQAGGFPDPFELLRQFYTDRLPGGADPALSDMNAAASLLPLGSAERETAYQDIAAYMAENPSNIVIAHVPASAVVRGTIHGLENCALCKQQTAWEVRNLWVSGPADG